MSDPLNGSGSQIGLTSQQLNVGTGSAVHLQHVLSAGTQNLNLLSTGGQQFVIASQVSVPGLTQVIPTLSTSNQSLQQSGVTRIVNITQPQRVVGRGSLQLTSPGNDGRVSFLAISSAPASGQIRAAHPTLVTSLASPVRQTQRTNSAISPAVVLASPTQPNNLVPTNLTRKRPKLYENLDNNFFNDEIGTIKRKILDSNSVKLNQYLTKYVECVSELFFLEADGNIIDFHTWKSKRQNTQQFFNFLQSNKLDLEDEDEDLSAVLALPDHENDSKQHTSGSASTSHTPPTSQLNQLGGNDSSVSNNSSSEKRSPTKQLNKLMLNPVARQHTRQHSISAVYDNSIGSQEQIVEKAKQEAYVVQRVSELQREGLWSEKRLPKVQEPPRNKAHWDYLLEEMVWLAADFAQERKWKKANAKKCAKMVQKYFQDKAIMLKKEEKSQELKLRKLANFMAKEVKNFWANVNKLVDYKQTTRLEEKRKKALDQHLSFIVDQTEKYSSWLAESMNKGGLDGTNRSSANCSRVASPVQKTSGTDDDFEPNSSSEDDEETIAKEECDAPQTNNSDEIERLKQESELPLEDLLKDLPEDYWNNRDKIDPGGDENVEETESNKSEDFTVDSANESTDDEETLDEQEKAEGKVDHSQELAELEAENNMDIEELMAKYSGAPDTEASSVPEDEEMESSSESSSSAESSEDEVDENEEDIGLKSLIDNESEKKESEGNSNEKANKEINDVAAIAESLQPKGNTLLTTSVVTPIPFLLKHILREYQHIGLDWLVTMFDRKLNGILADEMGLGKTIQTIALLAHLACEKGNWGPHLIIVPTSVMLNWEMELKKWCPAFKILTYYGTQKERKHKRAGWTKPNAFHVCITSYKLVIQDHQSFRRKKWKYLILDEAQNIKNFKSQRWQLLLNFQTQRRLLLTGTPLQNNLMELWSLMHFLMPNVFQSHREFKEWFSNPVTGMIEGNSEYNDAIIKRLHKVLRPFLLRRLKTEVEKQLPKKYEHVVMCRLSKRQRYLYDDFMSRAKTKETLASGNLLSVINVLMQLRKVCNHPNLFEVRPIISPFQMEGIVYYTASIVARALEYDPYKHVDLSYLNVLFVNLEKMTAYVSYRIKKIKAPRKLIEEIDSAPNDPPRCPPAKIKVCIRNPEKKPAPPVSTESKNLLGNLPPAKVGTSPLMKVLSLSGGSQGISLRISGSQVQLITSQAEAKSVCDGAQRGLPVQLIQTSSGRNLYFPLQAQAGSNTVIAANGQRLTLSKISTADVKLVNSNSNSCSPNKPVNWFPNVSLQATQGTLIVGTTTLTTTTTVTTTKTSSAISEPLSSSAVQSAENLVSSVQTSLPLRRGDGKNEQRRKQNSESDMKVFHIPAIEEKLKTRRREKLKLIANINDVRCEAYPLYGSDLISSIRIIDSVEPITNNWLCSGLTHCLNVHRTKGVYWSQTQYLNEAVKSPTDIMNDLHDIIRRFVFFVPAVAAPRLEFRVSHPSPSIYWGNKRDELALRKALSPLCNVLHPIASSMCTQFPDPRLIQYDCGKLQVLDKLLRKLKMNHHKVLLFTQMTRMLDILEAFLNYHGHIYLRLDGTTKVDQRQVLMERFNGDKRIFCFILSTRSGGIGVNLTGADTVIFYDSDWNPTMDAQAQDRCHRIGQTRDVHIYRLISEMTVEENILKKANQKRLLGDLAIEGGNFTTAYFKSSTIQDLFNVDVSETDASRRMAEVLGNDKDKKAVEEGESCDGGAVHIEDKAALGVLESALAAAEDESDVQAARTAKAEAAAELAEFDENIPFDDANDASHVETEMSKAEMEMNLLVEQLTPIERYAMRFVEENEATWSAEQLAAAEAQIEQQKREWELGRLQAMKAEEERRMQEEELDEDLLTYSREDATNQVNDFKIKKKSTRKKAQTSESESDETSDTTIDSLTEEEDDSNGELEDIDDSDFESKRKVRRNSIRNEKSNTSDNFNNSSRKTRSRGSVDINLWTLDENPILPGVKPVVRNTSSKDGQSSRKAVVKLVKLNGETYDHCKSKKRLSCPITNKAKRKRQCSSRESSDVDIISCSNDSNDSFSYVKSKSKGSKKIVDCNESNGPVSPRQLTVKN
ncbi:UNVERIFIED_CONTAM: hypothetical protein PYX00_005146 [Menopon gallinae]|uniref:Helicase domino n=1 Tax=Menopon gallinae TaxID=328185 RepID=A0AAW2HQX5_9NEOP